MPLTVANSGQLGATTGANSNCDEAHGSDPGSPFPMTDSIAVKRKTVVADGYGTSTETWATLITVNGRLIKPMRARETVQADAVKAITLWSALLPLGTDCVPADRLEIDGDLYEVTETDAALTGAAVLTVKLVHIKR